MKKLNKKDNRLLNIINKNNLCISNNPKGLDINWPKSYANLYYCYKLQKIYTHNNSPKILEINQDNSYRNKLWNCFFNKPIINEGKILCISDYLKCKSTGNKNKFDIIFIHNYKNIKNIFNLIKYLKKNLNRKGIIIIENINFAIPLIIRLFIFDKIKIYDYRLNSFLVNNCLIEIYPENGLNCLFHKFKNIRELIFFLFLDSISLIIVKILNSKNNTSL